MPPLTSAELAAVLGDADAETVADLLAALYAARGRPVEREDAATLHVGQADDPEVVAVPVDDADRAGADAVVTAGRDVDPGDAGAVDADDVAALLLYGVDRDVADEVLREHLGRSLSSFDGAPGTVGGPAEAGSSSSGSGASDRPNAGRTGGEAAGDAPAAEPARSDATGWRPDMDLPAGAAVVVLLGVVLVVAAGAVPAVDLGGSAPTPTSTQNGSETPSAGTGGAGAAPVGEDKVAPVDDGPSRSELAAADLPPGVDETGAIDETVLLAAHRAILANSSYRVTVTYREFVADRQTGVFVQTVRVGNATTYRSTTEQYGTLEGIPPRLDDGYAGGSRVRSDPDDGQPLDRAQRGPFVDDVVQYLGYYLSVRESRIADLETEDNRTTVWLATRGEPWPGAVDARGSAAVTEDGLVRMVRRSYDDADSPVHVVVTVRISDVGRRNVTASSGG